MRNPQKLLVNKAQKATIDNVAKALQADIYAYCGSIGYPYDCMFVSRVRDIQRTKNALVAMTSDGGSADAAFRMMRLLQHYYKGGKISFLIVDRCKSAGTLMAIGANEIIMADDAELGQLDVQLMKPDELGEYTSGLTAYQALTALRHETYQCFEENFLRLRKYSGFQITTRTAADIAAKLATGGVQKLYEQLDPMRIAEHQRAMLIAEQYGNRLNRGNLKPDALDRLIADYPSHGFLIDFAEAKELFTSVRLPSKAELELCYFLIRIGLCTERRNSPEPKILILTEDIEAAPADKKRGQKNEKRRSKPGSSKKTPSRNRLPFNGAGDEISSGAENGS